MARAHPIRYRLRTTSRGHDRYCEELVTQTGLLRDVLRGADLPADVPNCPGWAPASTRRRAVGNLRTVEPVVRTGPGDQVPDAAGPDGDDPAELDSWLAESATRFADTLRKAGPDAEAEPFGLRATCWRSRA